MKWYYQDMGKHKGFTIVEILVVVTVIAILATISVVSYTGMTERARDSKIRSVVKTAGDALQLYETKNNSLPSGQGKFNQANSVDSLAPQYLQRGYRDDAISKNASNKEDIFLWYQCKDGSGAVTGVAVFASLNSPTSDEASRVATVKADCHIAASVPTSGNPAYNYAQVF